MRFACSLKSGTSFPFFSACVTLESHRGVWEVGPEFVVLRGASRYAVHDIQTIWLL